MFVFGRTARACEPILPFVQVVGGPGMITQSWIILLAAVALKTIVFSVSQKKLSFVRASFLMIIGNVLTTVIGVIAAVLIGSEPLFWIGALIVWPICVMPARRFLAVTKRPWLKRFTPVSFAGIMAFALVVSCFLFAISSAFVDSNHLVAYWTWKLAAVYVALIVSILLTAFWEEWVIWRLSDCSPDYTGYVQPVIRANLIVLLFVMIFAAVVTLPQRLKSPNFLIPAGLVHHADLEAAANSSQSLPY